MPPNHLTRRSLLRTAAGAALLPTGALTALTACSSSSEGTSGAAANAKVTLPAYVPYPGVRADLPATAQGVLAGYTAYPARPVPVGGPPPAKGGKVTAMTLTYGTVPPAAGSNRYWQELNRRLGTELAVNVVPNADYATKLAIVMAGGDLPDLVTFYAALKPPRFPDLLRARFQDLTEHLSGDAVKDYPFLANVPTPSWRNAVFAGGVYGVPIPRGVVGTITFVRDDLVREKSLNGRPESFADFRELCRGLTDAKRNRWAMGNPDAMLGYLEEMAGAPNMWRERNGRFTHHYETEEAKLALSDMLTLLKDGVFHPDSVGSDTVQVKQWLQSGAVAVNRDGAASWSLNGPVGAEHPERYVAAMVAPGHDGGRGTQWAGGGAFGMVAFPKADRARITELLRVCDWLAAPFGTAEYLFRKYGLPGVHHELQGADPVLTQRGTTELTVPVNYLADSPPVLYEPGRPELTRAEHAFQERFVPLTVADPSIGLSADTQTGKGAQLDKHYLDTLHDIFAGRKKFSDWDEAVRQWRRTGGDRMREEYEQAFAQING